MIVTKKIVIHGEEMMLTNQRGLFWHKHHCLIVSDLHVGKTGHFRRHGIAVPASVLKADLMRLDELIVYFGVKLLIVVGDLLHAGNNQDLEIFQAWRQSHKNMKLLLVKGNHDNVIATLTSRFQIEVVPEYYLAPFYFVHEVNTIPQDSFVISGHIHPGVALKLTNRQYIRLVCFAKYDNHMILPAFSLFTGLQIIHKTDRSVTLYAVAKDSIFEL